MPRSLPGPCINCGHCWVRFLSLPKSKWVHCPKSLIHRKISQTFQIWQSKACAVLCGTWRCNAVLCDSWRLNLSLGKPPLASPSRQVSVPLIDRELIWVILPAGVCPSQVSDGVDANCSFISMATVSWSMNSSKRIRPPSRRMAEAWGSMKLEAEGRGPKRSGDSVFGIWMLSRRTWEHCTFVLVSFRYCDKLHDLKQFGEEWVYLAYIFPWQSIIEGSQGRNWRLEPDSRKGSRESYWTSYYTRRDCLPRGGTTLSELCPSHTNHQSRKWSPELPTGHFYGDIFPIKFPLPR